MNKRKRIKELESYVAFEKQRGFASAQRLGAVERMLAELGTAQAAKFGRHDEIEANRVTFLDNHDSRIDALEKRTAKILDHATREPARIGPLHERLEGFEGRLDEQRSRIQSLNKGLETEERRNEEFRDKTFKDFGDVDARLSALEAAPTTVTAFVKGLDEHSERIVDLEEWKEADAEWEEKIEDRVTTLERLAEQIEGAVRAGKVAAKQANADLKSVAGKPKPKGARK